MPGTYIEVEITTDPTIFDDLIGVLSVNGFDGFWEEGIRLRAYMKSAFWNDARRIELEELVGSITSQHALPTPVITMRVIEDQNWNALWEASILPVQVSERIVVAPTWHPYLPVPGQIVITIDPKMSFGTGHHETTRLTVQLLEKHVRAGDAMLDVGTGTGILAIAGVRLGASSAIGVDNDEWSYLNARENVKLNGVENLVMIVHGEIADLGVKSFGIITANIQRGVIERILPAMRRRLEPGGRLLLSGLLRGDREPIIAALGDQQLRIIDRLYEKEWIALAATDSSE